MLQFIVSGNLNKNRYCFVFTRLHGFTTIKEWLLKLDDRLAFSFALWAWFLIQIQHLHAYVRFKISLPWSALWQTADMQAIGCISWVSLQLDDLSAITSSCHKIYFWSHTGAVKRLVSQWGIWVQGASHRCTANCSIVFNAFHQCETPVKPLGTSASPRCLDGLTYTSSKYFGEKASQASADVALWLNHRRSRQIVVLSFWQIELSIYLAPVMSSVHCVSMCNLWWFILVFCKVNTNSPSEWPTARHFYISEKVCFSPPSNTIVLYFFNSVVDWAKFWSPGSSGGPPTPFRWLPNARSPEAVVLVLRRVWQQPSWQ